MNNLVSAVSLDRQTFLDSLNVFRSPSLRDQQGISLARAAHQVLESVTQLIQQQTGGDSKIPSEDQLPIELQGMTAPMRTALVRGTCVFIETEKKDDFQDVINIADRLIDTEHGRGTNLPSRLAKLRSQIATAS